MTSATHIAALVLVAVITTGCGSTVRNMLERGDPPQEQTAVRQELTMPPDLRLPPPGSAPEPAPAAQETTQAYETSPSATVPVAPADRPKYGDDAYAQAGISVYNPDGTRKSDAQLHDELQNYYIAKKRQKNPNYGTVFNMGNIFKDE